MKGMAFSSPMCLLAILFLSASLQAQPTVDARAPVRERAAQASTTRGSSIGRKMLLRVSITAVGSRDDEGKVEIDFTLTNIGKEPLQLPVSPEPARSGGSESKLGYTATRLSLGILPRKRPAGILAGGAVLYGTSRDSASMVTLFEGDSIRVLTRVALPQNAGTADEGLVASANLGKETITEENGQLVSDLEDIGSAYSQEYFMRDLVPSK
jgi:hypothetical protein